MAYGTHGKLGVNLTSVFAGTGSSSDEGDQHLLGEVVKTQDGGRYMRVHASAAVTQYDAVGIDENFEAAPLTKVMADDGWFIGFAQIAMSDNDFGWVAMSGANIQCRFLSSCVEDVALYTSASAGRIDDASGSQTKVDGLVLVATVTAAASAEVIATHVRSTTF